MRENQAKPDRPPFPLRLPRPGDEIPDQADILDPRRAFDTGGDVEARRPGFHRRHHILAVEPARQHPGQARGDVFQDRPVEGHAVAAGQNRTLGRFGVEQQPVGDILVSCGSGQVVARRNRDRLHHRQAGTGLQVAHPLRRLVAVQLQHVGAQRCDDPVDEGIIGVDRKRHLAGPPGDQRRQARQPGQTTDGAGSWEKTQSRPCRRPHSGRPPGLARWKARRF